MFLVKNDKYGGFIQRFKGIFYSCDTSLRPLFFGGAVEAITGYSDSELLRGMPEWEQIIHHDDRPEVHNTRERLCSTPDCSFEIEYRILRRDGEVVWVNEVVNNVCDDNGNPIMLQGIIYNISARKDAEEELRNIVEKTSYVTGKDFFAALTSSLAKLFNVRYALIGELIDNGDRIRTMAVWDHDHIAGNFEYDIADTPCEAAIFREKCFYPRRVIESFPQDHILKEKGIEGYWGVRLNDSIGNAVGLLVLMHDKPMVRGQNAGAMLDVFAARAGSTLERVHIEKMLKKKEDSLIEAQRIAHLGNWDWDIAKNKLYWSEEMHSIFGVEQDGFGATYGAFLDCVHPDDRELVKRHIYGALYDRETYSVDYRIIRPDGSERILHGQGKVVYNGNNMPVRMIGTVQDITERKQVEEALKIRVSQQAKVAEFGQYALGGPDLTDLFDTAVKLVAATFKVEYAKILEFFPDADSLLLVAGIGWEEGLIGTARISAGKRSQAGYTMLSSDPVIVEDFPTEPRFDDPELLRNHNVISGLSVIIHGKGGPFGVFGAHTSSKRIFTKDDVNFLQALANILAQAIDRKRSEESLEAERGRLAVTLRSIGEGVIATDIDGKVVLVNRSAEEITGWIQEESLGKGCLDVLKLLSENGRYRPEGFIRDVLTNGENIDMAGCMLESRNGSRKMLTLSGAPIRDHRDNIIGMVIVFNDITLKKKIEEEMLKSSKLESLGLLAGGIAHDFNNILTAIMGNISIAKICLNRESKAFDRLVEADKAAQRAKLLTQELLAFSKGGAPVRKNVAINGFLMDWCRFALRGSDVQCDFHISEEPLYADIDKEQICQVINNLVINARQAMRKGGVIRFKAENVMIYKDSYLPLRPGKYVKITIRDHGVGIPNKDMPNIFDPYFTTMEGGSGLGLTASYAIVKNHNGYIAVDSVVGQGTTFDVYLPAAENESGTEPDIVMRGSGRILVVDDEAIVRDTVGTMLRSIGYRVEFSKDGEEAIDAYKKAKESGEPFDAVILDLTIPGGLGGISVMQRLLDIDPGVRAILSSGYSNDQVMSSFSDYGFSDFIAKPYSIGELSKVLRTTIAKRR